MSEGTIHIVITGDYEIFGDGTGDVKKCMIEPTYELMGICEKFGAKYTLFAEVCEYWAFKKTKEARKIKFNYSPSEEIEKQLKEAIRRGHDVQLHFHPQWLESKYTENSWKVNLNYWRLPKVPHGLGSYDDELSLRGLFLKGISTLERLLMPVDPSYRCIAFRAGGWCIQPSKKVIATMLDMGILADTTVFKWGYNTRWPFFYDFRSACSQCDPWWIDPEDINRAREDNKGTVLEVPNYSFREASFYRIPAIIHSRIINRTHLRQSSRCEGSPVGARQSKILRLERDLLKIFKIFGRSILQWSYESLSNREIIKMFESYIARHIRDSKVRPGVHIVVMSGHPKGFLNPSEFRKSLLVISKYVSECEKIRFSTMQKAVEDFYRNEAVSLMALYKNERRLANYHEYDVAVYGKKIGEAQVILPLYVSENINRAEILNNGSVCKSQDYPLRCAPKKLGFKVTRKQNYRLRVYLSDRA